MEGITEDDSSPSFSSDQRGHAGEHVAMDPPEEDSNSGYADPESPNSKADSSSSSSEGVLVELPAGADQDSRGLPSDQDGGILVNIDGSMMEHAEEDGSRRGEEMFVDAPDQLGFVEGRRSVGLEESMAVIEIGESNGERRLKEEVARLQTELEESEARCGKYKEERGLLGSEIVNLQHHLRAMVDGQSGRDDGGLPESLDRGEIQEEGGVDGDSMASLSLHNVVSECFELALHLRRSLDEVAQSEAKIKEVVSYKDREIEELNSKLSECSVSRDIISSYLDSVKNENSDAMKEFSDAAIQRLFISLSTVVHDDEHLEGSFDEKIHVLEERAKFLVGKYSIFMHEVEQLGQCLSASRSDFIVPPEDQVGIVFEAVRTDLLEGKAKELHLLSKIDELEQEKSKVLEEINKMKEALEESSSEVSKTKLELEQAENKFLMVKEKLSIAVTKGKSLVQQRDTLKQSLTEKTNELEKCLQELQQKSIALEAAEGINEELRQHKEAVLSLETAVRERDEMLHVVERDLSVYDYPGELQPDVTGKIRWLVDQLKESERAVLENSKIQAALSSVTFPETISFSMLEDQINWLGTSFSKAIEDANKLENELASVQATLEAYESKLMGSRGEIENLTESLFVEKQGKESLQVLYEELTSKYEGLTERLTQVSSVNAHLVRVLEEISECTINDEASGDIDALRNKCIEKIEERVNSSAVTSSNLMEVLQRMQSLLYVRSLELILCEEILDEEMVTQSEKTSTLEELQRATSEVLALRNERDALQKDLERSEERSSLLKEKLSMAVKKGKGLVQEREGLRHSVEEKNTEIENLKKELELKDSTNVEYKEQIRVLTIELEKAQKLESDMKDEKNEVECILLESNSRLQKIMESIQQILLPSDISITDPLERLTLISQYIRDTGVQMDYVVQELEKQKAVAVLQATQLTDANGAIRSLEDTLIEKEKQISFILDEKKNAQSGKDSAELELENLKEEYHALTVELKQAYETMNSLKDSLTGAENRISVLMDEKAESESKSKLAIATLNAKIASYMDELEGTHGNLENQSAEIVHHLWELRSLIKDERVISSMAEVFEKNIGALRKAVPLLNDISGQISLEESQLNSGSKLEDALSRFISLPEIGDHMHVKSLLPDTNIAESANTPLSFPEVAAELTAHNTFLGETLERFSSYLDFNITLLLQVLEATRDEVIHLVEHKGSLKLKLNNLDALRDGRENEISKLQNDVKILLSACSDAVQTLQIDIPTLIFTDTSGVEAKFKDEEADGNFVGEPVYTAQKLVITASRIKGQIEHLLSVESGLTETVENLKNKLKGAEFLAESVREDRDVQQKQVSHLESELQVLQSVCNEMKSNIEDYQSKEAVWKDKEEELLSLQQQLAVKGREDDIMLISDGQLEYLFGQVNKVEIPFKELELRAPEQEISSPIDKLFYVVNNIAALQKMLSSVVVEKDDLQSVVALHGHEVDELKKINKNFTRISEELQQKTNDLNDLMVILERVVLKLGGHGSLEENKALDAKGLLLLLEKLILSTCEESGNFKLRSQELGTKLLASQKVVDELSIMVKSLEDTIQARSISPEIKDRGIFEASTSKTGAEISEIEDVGTLGKKSVSPVPAAAHARMTRKSSSDHLALSIDVESDRTISYGYEKDDKGRVFKSLNSSGLIPKQGKMVADRIDGIWVSGGRILMGRPEARMGLIAYSILLHLWVLATII